MTVVSDAATLPIGTIGAIGPTSNMPGPWADRGSAIAGERSAP